MIDLTNMQFGELTVIRQAGRTKSKSIIWECKRSCGKIINVDGARLRYGKKTSCGHIEAEQKREQDAMMIGKRFGRWTIMYPLKKRTKRREKVWHCKCDCGNERDVTSYLLTSGQSKSCGCLQKEIAAEIGHKSLIDITGQRFGQLVAIKPVLSNNREKHTKWICQCDCGNILEVDLGNLRGGKSRSCGCVLSTNENFIIHTLSENNINYKYQYIFNDLPNKPFDFYINDQYILEYDGAQHFIYSNTGWNNKEKLIRTHKNDLIKNEFCFSHNIPIIRIPYNMDYDIDDLFINSTSFLLTKENMSQYYNNAYLRDIQTELGGKENELCQPSCA